MLKLYKKMYKMLKTIKKPHKSITNKDKDQTNRYSIKFENSFIFNKGRQRIAPVID